MEVLEEEKGQSNQFKSSEPAFHLHHINPL